MYFPILFSFNVLLLNLKYILVLWLIASLGSELYGQKHHYSVHRGGKEIGAITASLIEVQETQTYEIHSDVRFKVLWKNYHRKTSNLVTYLGDTMKTSSLGIYMNDDLQDSTTIKFELNNYRCYRYPDDRFILQDTHLQFTTAKLYFQEPVGVHRVYSERFLQYCSLEQQGDHHYKLSLPSGKTNYYTYKDSKLEKVLIDRTWFNLEFRKK